MRLSPIPTAHPIRTTMSFDEDTTLFDRIGGADKIKQIVDEMYARIFKDPDLMAFFKNADEDRLLRMQFQFISSALDGPVNYSGAELTAIHKNLEITPEHFAKFCGHFADAMEHLGVDNRDIDNALGRLATYRDKIIGRSNMAG